MTAQLSRERLEEIRDYDTCVTLDESAEMASMLLAVMDSKPVAVIDKEGSPMTRAECNDDRVFAICCKVGTPLYAAPPAPVAVPDDAESRILEAVDILKAAAPRMVACTELQDPKSGALVGRTKQKTMLNAGPVTGWIKCSKRMPPLNNGQMWIYSPTRGVKFMFALAASGAYYDTCDSEEDITDATHWMPIVIPAAPEQEV